jgi:hypothetical protein
MDRRVDAINESAWPTYSIRLTDSALTGSRYIAVSVIRMIKLFAFTDNIASEIDQKRAEELKYVWKLKVFQVFNQVLS